MAPKLYLLMALVCFGTQISFAAVEDSRILGFGFHLDVIAEPTNNPSESIAHREYLFYGRHRLSEISNCAIAPSGEAVVYQDGPSGDIFMFERKPQRTVKLRSYPGLVEKFVWHEGGKYIMALTDTKSHSRWLRLETDKKFGP
jgi:hypothetical protein